jgi:hypothetical protein
MGTRLPLEIVEHRARIFGARVCDGGADALYDGDDATGRDELLLLRTSRRCVSFMK